MKLIARIIFYALINLAAFAGTAYVLPGFEISGNLTEIFLAAGFLALLNIFIRPILKFIFGPFIILTFGLFIIVLNAFILYLVDILSAGISIDGIGTLILASLIIGLINFIISLSARRLDQKT